MLHTKRSSVVAVAVVTALSSSAFAQPDADKMFPPMLTVSGRGEYQAQPDRAVLTFGAVAESTEAAAAQNAVNQIMADAIEAVTKLDIPQNKLTTSNLSLHPVFDHDREPRPMDQSTGPAIRGYMASYTLTVVVDDIDMVGDVVDTVLESGVNQFHGVQFTLQDDTQARAEALKGAVRDARSKAATIAEAMDVELGQVRQVSEGGSFFPPPQPMFGARMMMAEADTPIQPGELTISATVSVTYAINAAP